MQEVNEYSFFNTLIWKLQFPEYVKDLNKLCDPYIKKAIKHNLDDLKKNKDINKKLKKDFGMSHHSTSLFHDKDFTFLKNLIAEKSNDFITSCGFDIKNKALYFSELWVQQFSKLGGGHHSTHVHYNQHVSGFYFLKASELTSFPRFYDPRPGAVMTKLPFLKPNELNSATEIIHFSVKPGDMIIFPGYLAHEFSVDNGIEPFRFIHWNLQYVERN